MMTSATTRYSRRLVIDMFRGFLVLSWFITYSIAPASRDLPDTLIRWLVLTLFTHAEWHGYHFVDIGFPGPTVLIALSMAYSNDALLRNGKTRRDLLLRVVKRVLAFLVFSFFYQGGFLQHYPAMVFTGTFFRLAIAMVFCGFALLFLSLRAQAILLGLFLAVQSAVFLCVPTVGAAGRFSEELNIKQYVAEMLLPGLPGFLGIAEYPALVRQFWWWFFLPEMLGICLVGALLSRLLMNGSEARDQVRALVWVGVAGILMGYLLDCWIPINAKLWTPSYTVFSMGMIGLYLAVFMFLSEVVDIKFLKTLLLPLGKHPLFSILWFEIMARGDYAGRFAGAGFPVNLGVYHSILMAIAQCALAYFPILWLYRREERISPICYLNGEPGGSDGTR